MPQEYTVKSWKPWENEAGLIRDPHGNYKGTVTFEEDHSEPIDATFKNQPSVGDKKYGTVGDYQTKAGNTRRGFKSVKKLDVASPIAQSGAYKDNSDGQRQGMCFNNATLFVNMMVEGEKSKPSPEEWAEIVFAHAQALYLKGDLRQPSEATHDNLVSAGLVKPDVVVTDINEDEPINLNDIPF